VLKNGDCPIASAAYSIQACEECLSVGFRRPVNMFCEKVGGPCVCRIERILARNDLTETVEALDLSVNQLTQLPPSLYKLSKMKTLNLRDNDLATLIADDFLHLTELETMDLSNNPIENSVSVIESLQVALPKVKIIFHT
jgi:hypothetical protein